MPRYKKPGTGRDFLPGNNANPNGRPKDPPELKELKKLTKSQLENLIFKIFNSDPSQLKEFKGNVLELWLASGASKGIQSGDFGRLESLFNRAIGPLTNKVEITEYEKYDSFTDEEMVIELRKRADDLEKKIKEKK